MVWKEFNDDSISIYIFIIEAWIAIRLYVTRAILHSLHSLVPRRILAFFSSELYPSPCRDFYRFSSHPSSLDPPPIWTSEITPDYSRDVLDWLTLIVKISNAIDESTNDSWSSLWMEEDIVEGVIFFSLKGILLHVVSSF